MATEADFGYSVRRQNVEPFIGNKAPEVDQVSRPDHYRYGKVETIDYIMQVCAIYPGHQAALVANVIKYISRAPLKGDKEKDLKKAQWYLNRLLESL